MRFPHGTTRRAILALALAVTGTTAFSQAAYPTKPIRLVVPFPPGGGTDLIARTVAQKLTDSLKWTIVIDNRPGAGGNIGVDTVAKSAPDGYTLVIGQTSNLAVNPTLYPKLPYDPVKDFAPVSLLAVVPNVLVVNAGNSNAFTGPKGVLKNEATLKAVTETAATHRAG